MVQYTCMYYGAIQGIFMISPLKVMEFMVNLSWKYVSKSLNVFFHIVKQWNHHNVHFFVVCEQLVTLYVSSFICFHCKEYRNITNLFLLELPFIKMYYICNRMKIICILRSPRRISDTFHKSTSLNLVPFLVTCPDLHQFWLNHIFTYYNI